MDIEKANFETTQRMMEARPVVVGMGKAIDVIPGMRENLLLHAGSAHHLGARLWADARRDHRRADL